MILDDIIAYKRVELQGQRQRVSLAELQARPRLPRLDFAAALGRPGAGLIAEVKRASPSRGLLCPDFDPLRLALTYAAHGAAAISVLTDRRFFQGELAYLESIKATLLQAGSAVPLLRKDFIFDSYQVYEAAAYGADALLLIAAVLSDDDLAELLALTYSLGLAALVEVHDQAELKRVARLRLPDGQPLIVGVNNRDLRTFKVELATFERLRPLLPRGVLSVAESGLHTAADVRRLAAAGADAVLVGEALVTAADVAGQVRALADGGKLPDAAGQERPPGPVTQGNLSAFPGLPAAEAYRPRVKICGITNLDDACLAAAAGADLLGFVFYPPSPRCVSPSQARSIVQALRAQSDRPPRCVGVFVNMPAAPLAEVLEGCDLDIAQLHGDEPPELAASLARQGWGVIKALRMRAAADLNGLADYPAQLFLLDAYVPGQPGGSGHSFDWTLAAQAGFDRPFILAGGLHAGNVAQAVRAVRPWGVDVSSGVEAQPGRKDPAKVQAFIQALRV